MLTLAEVKALLVLLAIGLLVYAVIDCGRTPEQEVPGGIPRSAWLVLVIIVPILGPLLWIFASRSDQNSPGRGDRAPRGPRPGGGGTSGRRSSRPLGPDDDPDFLRGI